MSRLIRWVLLVALVIPLPGAMLWAQAGPLVQDDPGPEFLLAGEDGRAPVRIEPDRVPLLNRRIKIDLPDTTLDAALGEISKQSSLRLIYSARVVPLDNRVSLTAEDITVASALREVLRNANVNVMVHGNQAVLVRRPPRSDRATKNQKPGTIIGRVTAADTQTPIAGAQVLLDGVGRAVTNGEGRYMIANVAPGARVVSVVSIGYRGAAQEVQVGDGATVTVDFALESAPTQLSELVVTATGEQRRIELGHDVTVIRVDSIMATAPVTSVTDLLEGRVPGLVVQRTSGAPGDPARLRLRGVSSPMMSNDPIIIVDGIRVYSELSTARAANLGGTGGTGGSTYATPSPLDYIDPYSIETIQVVRGPSAATMYGQDAANGVIIITTKRGRPGPPSWRTTVERGFTETPGRYPDLHLRMGRLLTDDSRVFCPLNNWAGGDIFIGKVPCQADTVVTYQMLNDPELTVLDRGERTAVSVGVSGGSSTLTYNITGTYMDEVGTIKLPRYEIMRYRAERGIEPASWMLRPQNHTIWGVTLGAMANLGRSADLSLTTQLTRSQQQRSALEQQLGTLMSTYLDRATGTYYEASSYGRIQDVSGELLDRFYERATSNATHFKQGLALNWRPREWVTITSNVGLQVVSRADEVYSPPGGHDWRYQDGRLGVGKGQSVESSFKVHATSQLPLPGGFVFKLNTGVDFSNTREDDLHLDVRKLPEGMETVTAAAEVYYKKQHYSDRSTFGWFVEPGINHRRLWISSGLRLDGGSNFGSRVKLPRFPKLSVSYLLSDEPFFPERLQTVVGSLRLRAAYGHAGRQPGPTDRLRLYDARTQIWLGEGTAIDAIQLRSVGNSDVRPERTKEFEAGFDADLFDDRVKLGVTGYRKTTVDALLSVDVAPSVYGSGVKTMMNIGVVRNTGFELEFGVEPIRSDLVTWYTRTQLSHNRNIVVELGPGVEPFFPEVNTTNPASITSGIRVAPGYPLFGRWAKPVLGYADANGDGVLDPSEVVLGDTLVYVGGTLPNYTASISTGVSLFRGTLAIDMGFQYESGMTQVNEMSRRLAPFSRGWNDPTASLSEQVAVFDLTEFTWVQTVNSLRFHSLSISYQVPIRIANRLGARALALSVQGSNLGLWTNYRGMDPNVNARVSGNDVRDTGVLPTPRVWQVRLTATH